MTVQIKQMLPPGYVVAALTASLGGFLNGYDSGSIGAVTVMPEFEKSFGILTPIMRGFTVSLVMLTATLPSVFAGHLADRFGRLRIVGLGALIFAIGAIFQGSAPVLEMFLVGRALAGLGEGVWLSNVSVYICEIAPSARRGMLVSMPQLMACAGICAGYFVCYGTVHISSSMSWRLPYLIQSSIAVILAVSCKFLPDSPRWLVLHDRREHALKQIERLGIHQAEAEKDIMSVPNGEQASLEKSPVKGFLMLFHRQYRARTMLALFVLGMVQLSGIDGIIFYAPILFQQAGIPGSTAGFLASGASAILFLVVSIPAMLYADKWGRRTSVITGGVGLSACMLIIGSLYAAKGVHAVGAGRWVVIVLIFVFGITYSVTWGVVGKIYASEIQPAKTRASANCVAQGLNFFTNWLVGFGTPILLASSSYGAYFLFGGLSVCTVAVLAIYMPETRGKPLESIQEAFQRPLLRSWTHHIRGVLSDSRTDSIVSDGAVSEVLAPFELSRLSLNSGLRIEMGIIAGI